MGAAGTKEYRELCRKVVAGVRRKGAKWLEEIEVPKLEDVLKTGESNETKQTLTKPSIEKPLIEASNPDEGLKNKKETHADKELLEGISQSKERERNDIVNENADATKSKECTINNARDIPDIQAEQNIQATNTLEDNKASASRDNSNEANMESREEAKRSVNDSIAELLQEEQELLSQSVLSDESEGKDQLATPNILAGENSGSSPVESEGAAKVNWMSDTMCRAAPTQAADFMLDVHYSESDSMLSGVSRRSNIDSLQNACQRKRLDLEVCKQRLVDAEAELVHCMLRN